MFFAPAAVFCVNLTNTAILRRFVMYAVAGFYTNPVSLANICAELKPEKRARG